MIAFNNVEHGICFSHIYDFPCTSFFYWTINKWFARLNIRTSTTIFISWEDYLNDPIRIQDDDGDNNITREVERMRSNDEINEEMMGGEYVSEGAANFPWWTQRFALCHML